MAEFKGCKLKVRCVDCTHLEGRHCSAKNAKVASTKKKRMCKSYDFKGTFENRTPAKSTYVPYVDKNTRRAIRKLLKMGIVPISEAEIPEGFEGFHKTSKILQMPKSTAVLAGKDQSVLYPERDYAATNVILPVEEPAIDEERKEDRLIWMPGDD